MKKFILCGIILSQLVSGAVFAGDLVKQVGFDATRGLRKWPANATLELDTEKKHSGKSSIVFTPDNHYVAYFYQKMQPNRQYTVSFWYMLEKVPIKRCGIIFNFNKKDGGNGSAGKKLFSMSEFAEADGQWHQFTGTFTTPADTAISQIQLSFYRTNAVVFIDEFKLYEGASIANAAVPEAVVKRESNSDKSTVTAPAVAAAPASGQLVKSFNFSNSSGWTKWPKANTIEIEKATGSNDKNSVVFTPDNNYCLYYYQRFKPSMTYQVNFFWKADKMPYKRCGFTLYFTSKGGKRGDKGVKNISLSSLGAISEQWQAGSFTFVFPEGAYTCQFMLNFYRSNAVVQIAELKIYETSENLTQKKN
jgi:hypothetical protein